MSLTLKTLILELWRLKKKCFVNISILPERKTPLINLFNTSIPQKLIIVLDSPKILTVNTYFLVVDSSNF